MTIKVLCISEGADKPTTAMFVGIHGPDIDVTVACPKSSETYAVLSEKGVPLINMHIRRRFDIRGIRLLRKELLQGNYDIIHVFNNKALQNGLIATWGISVRIVAYSCLLYTSDAADE